MTTKAEQIIKLTTKLANAEAKMISAQQDYDSISNQITSVLAGGTWGGSSAKTTTYTKPKTGNMSERIITYLQSNPGQNIQQLAKALKTEAKRVGLSLYHLGNKKMVFSEQGNYFASVPLTAALKETTPEDGND